MRDSEPGPPQRLSRRAVCKLFGTASLAAPFKGATARRYRSRLIAGAYTVRLEFGETSYRFVERQGWRFESVRVRGRVVALPLDPANSFYQQSGSAHSFQQISEPGEPVRVRFLFASGAAVTFAAEEATPLPFVRQSFEGVPEPMCAWRTPGEDPNQHGAWVTRGETATDAEQRDVFIDASGGLLFGHSLAGDLDTAYVFRFKLKRNIDPQGRTEQRTGTFFGSRRVRGNTGFAGCWQVRLGADQPKEFSILFDRDLGGRLHHVCDRYYAAAVDAQLDLGAVRSDYDPYRALEWMPVRLSCPESLIPQCGWHMEEYPRAAYPYGHDCGIQTAALLAFEGHATGRDWEKYFGQWAMEQMPLWGSRDGAGFFTERPGGWTRWAGNSDYTNCFPLLEGGNWTDSEHLYHTAVLFGDADLKAKALGLMKHDVHVKLDLERMYFPPCWNPLSGKLEDHRDDWETTAGVAYCAEVCSEILFRETRDPQYLAIADRITDWFLRQLWPEQRMNYLHPSVNTYHCFMGPIVRALVHRYERQHDTRFLEIAQDMAWVMILTLATTVDQDPAGRSLTGVTCVGVRGCVDYDCAPNLCHEKDQAFLYIAGALLPYVSTAGYAKLLAMQHLVLPRDSWEQAFGIQEQRDLNLRTNYDNYARAMANLAFALNRSSEPSIPAYELLVPRRDRAIRTRREVYLVNGTERDRETTLQVRFLHPGLYRVRVEGAPPASYHSGELERRGLRVLVSANSLRRVSVAAERLEKTSRASATDGRQTWLSDLEPYAAQRGTGLPQRVYGRDRSFNGNPLRLKDQIYGKGLGLAANTVLLYAVERRYRQFTAHFGIDPDTSGRRPEPSVNLTIFVDGRCHFASGPTSAQTPVQAIEISLAGVSMLTLRLAGNWDNDGDLSNDLANLVDAQLVS